jgi:hypothetical protein
MRRFGNWLQASLVRFVILLIVLQAINTLVLTTMGGIMAIIAGPVTVLIIVWLTTLYLGRGSR